MKTELGHDTATAQRGAGPVRRVVLWFAAGATAAGSLVHRMAQPVAYHDFADTRAFLGIPHFTNVVSNLAFVVVGFIGLWGLARSRPAPVFLDNRERMMFRAFFVAAVLVAAGSGAYHLAPSNQTLFWDRLPMGICLAAFAGGLTGGRVGAAAGVRVFGSLCLLMPATLVYWIWTESRGEGNVWPYLCWMYGSLGSMALMMLLYRPRYTRSVHEWAALGFFVAAMLFDKLLDGWLLSLGRVMGGHALKHVLAALAMYWLWRNCLRNRTALE